jgi:AcrR family transcriptional regulator
MPAADRRTAIAQAALPLIREHGRATTTKQIAEAAGIAEGTIFRVFGSKEEIFEEVLAVVFDPAGFIADLQAMDRGQPIRDRMIAMTARMQRNFLGVFELLTALALPKPPDRFRDESGQKIRAEILRLQSQLLAPDAAAFRLPVEEVVRTLRLLTFSASHPHISDGRIMSPEEIVDLVLHGTLRKEG